LIAWNFLQISASSATLCESIFLSYIQYIKYLSFTMMHPFSTA